MEAKKVRLAPLYDRLIFKPDPADRPVPPSRFCTVPLLVFTTGRGSITPTDQAAQELRQHLPGTNAHLVAVVASGHWIHRELPDLFNTELLKFLRTVQHKNN